MEMNTSAPLVFPPLWKRMGAYLIDIYFVFILAYVIISLLPKFIADSFRLPIFLLVIFYDPICNSSLGYTFGAFLFKFRVRSAANTDEKLSFGKAFIRYVVKLLLGSISFWTIHSDSMRRAIHDNVAGSVVISK